MTHAATLRSLVDVLVTSVTGLNSKDKSFNALRDKASRGLKDQSSPRTNQFEVKASYTGLVEKFEVLNRDDLAIALQSRMAELAVDDTKFMPEILSLLLQLSDKPVEKTRIGSLRELIPPEDQVITWSSVIADEPAANDGLWDDIERGYHSSGDEVSNPDDNDGDYTNSTQATSLGDEDFASLARLHVVTTSGSFSQDVQINDKYLNRSHDGQSMVVSELSLSREILTMLYGYPTSLFGMEPNAGRVWIRRHIALATASGSTISTILDQCVELGTKVNFLRSWSRAKEQIDWVQSMQGSVQALLVGFHHQLAVMEKRYVRPVANEVVSLIRLSVDIEVAAHPLLHLSHTLQHCISSTTGDAEPQRHALLDSLYEEVCLVQLAGDHQTFNVLSKILIAGVHTYLRSISEWLRYGILPFTNRDTFLVHDCVADCSLADVWYRRYQLRTTSHGRLAIPSFMQPYAEEVFAMGKIKAFLRIVSRIDEHETPGPFETDSTDSIAGLAEIDQQSSVELAVPFADSLAEHLGTWLSRTALDSTPILRKTLFVEHGLADVMRALEYVYFAKDGCLFEMFADSLLTRISHGQNFTIPSRGARKSWKDNFMLSELAHNTLGASELVDAGILTMRCLAHDDHRSMGAVVTTTHEISTVVVEYHFSWPIQNITREHTSSVHGKALMFLLQIHSAKSRMSTQLLDFQPFNRRASLPSPSVKMALMLRQRLIWSLEVIHDHVTSASSTQHNAMTNHMALANSIDEMASVWASYTKHLETSLLIANKLAPVKNAVIKIIELCEQFVELWKQLMVTEDLLQSKVSVDPAVEQQNLATTKLLNEQFDGSVHFVIAGLKSIGRAGADTALEMLAQRLDWKHA